MLRSEQHVAEMDALGQVVRAVERKLGLALVVLGLGIAAILTLGFGQPAFQYLMGPEVQFTAAGEGAGCGAHLEWVSDTREIKAGSIVEFTNDAQYWQIPVLIERRESDGSYTHVAESPRLEEGESWTHTFWRRGEYRIAAREDVLRYAGLDTTITIA